MADKKNQKTPKMIPAKKLPKILKKSYSDKAFEKDILNKIYIEADKKFISELFDSSKDKDGRHFFCADISKSIKKADFKRYKKIAKEIAMQKPAVKLIPLLAVACLVIAVGISTMLFKNVIVSHALRTSMQDIFEAKTDIAKVNLKIFGASLEIDGLEQANKDSPMKNLFSIDRIFINFNLTDLLKGKFHGENVEVTGVALDTDRKKTGLLPAKTKKTASANAEKKIKSDSKGFSADAAKKLQSMFASYNPETMLDGIKNDLKSPVVAEKISGQVKQKVEKWQNVPAEYENSVRSFSDDVESLIKTDWSRMSDPVQIKSTVEKINRAIKESESLQKKLSQSAEGIKTDAQEVASYSNELQSAVKADSAIVDRKIEEMKKTFKPAGLNEIMNDAVRSILYSVSGKYFPYVDKVVTSALNSKNSGNKDAKVEKSDVKKAVKAKKSKKTGHSRAEGRNVYYKKDNVPKFLIEKVSASGYEYKTNDLLFSGSATEISSDQNIRGKPTEIKADFKIMGNLNSAAVVVDARSDSDAKLITASYSGKGYPVYADAEIFKLNSDANIMAKITADDDGSFAVKGTVDFIVKDLTGMEFQPERISELYGRAVKNVSKITVGFVLSYSLENGLRVELTDTDRIAMQLSAPVAKALQAELSAIADGAKNDVTKVLLENTGAAQEQIAQFADIRTALNMQLGSVNDMKLQLEKKKKEAEGKAVNAAKEAAADVAKDALKRFF